MAQTETHTPMVKELIKGLMSMDMDSSLASSRFQ